MTVASSTSRASYAGNGVTTAFTVPFRFLDQAHLAVYLIDDDGVEHLQTLTTHYTVSGTGGVSGTVTMVTPPTADERIVILRAVPLTQAKDYVTGDKFPAESHEEALDKLTMIVQQHQEELDRSVKVPIADDDAEFEALSAAIIVVGGIADEVALVAGIDDEVVAVAGNAGDISAVAGSIASVNTTAANMAAILAAPAEADAAAASAAAAQTAETNAETAETNAETAQAAAAASASAASTSAGAASTSAGTATTQAGAASSSASAAAASASAASTSAGNAAASAAAADASADAAAASAAAAADKVPLDGSVAMTDALMTTELAFTPATPASGAAKFYRKTDGKWYGLNDAGVETEIGSGAGGAAAGYDPLLPQRFGFEKEFTSQILNRIDLFGELTRHASNPVIPRGSGGTFDDYGVRGLHLLVDEDGMLAQIGGLYYGYYSASDSTSRVISVATSPDLVTWTKHGSAILSGSGTGGAFDEGGVATGTAIKMADNSVRLYYNGLNAAMATAGVGLATSANGISFTRHVSNPLVAPAHFTGLETSGSVAVPYCIKTSVGWVLLVEGSAKGPQGWGIFGSISADGLTGWTAINGGNVVLGARFGTWTALGVANPKLYELDEGNFLLTFNAESEENFWRGAAAWCTDPALSEWNMAPEGAFFGQGEFGDWDTHRIEDILLVKDDIMNGADDVRMFYFGTTGNDSHDTAQIGMATISQVSPGFKSWLAPGISNHWTVTEERAPWGANGSAVKINHHTTGGHGYLCSRPFEFGRGVRANFTFVVEAISSENASSRGVRFSLRSGPDQFAQSGLSYPSLLLRRIGGNILLQYWDATAGTATTILSNVEVGRPYSVEMRLRSDALDYDVLVDDTNANLNIDAGTTTKPRCCFVIDGFSTSSAVVFVGDVQVSPI